MIRKGVKKQGLNIIKIYRSEKNCMRGYKLGVSFRLLG